MILSGGIQFGWGGGVSRLTIFLKPLQEQFGWTRAQISVAASLQRLEGGIEALPEGMAIDKWGPRATHTAAVIVFSLALASMYFVNSLWMFYVFWLLVATGHNMGYSGALDKAVADWYVRRRGLMLSVMRSINSGITPLALMLISWVLYSYGWREAFLVAGGATLVTGLPLTWFLIKPKRPEYYGWLPDGKRIGEEVAANTDAMIKAGVDYTAKTTGEVEFTLRQALKDRTIWIYLVYFTTRGLATAVIGLHLVPYLTDIGLDPIVAAGALGASSLTQIPGRLVFGWLADRINIRQMKYLVILGVLIQGSGVVFLILTKDLAWLWAFVVVYGIGEGANTTMGGGVLRARFWGRKAFASISGMVQTVSGVFGIIAPIYAGWIYDTTGSYMTAFYLLVATMVAAAVVGLFLNPPKPPARIGKVTEFV